jgi:hypothetical protein
VNIRSGASVTGSTGSVGMTTGSSSVSSAGKGSHRYSARPVTMFLTSPFYFQLQ